MKISNLTNEDLKILKSTGRVKYLDEDGKYVFIKEKPYQPIHAIEQAFEGRFDDAINYQYRNGISAVKRDSNWFFLSHDGVFLDDLGLFRVVEKDENGGNFIAYGDPKINKGVRIINPFLGKVIFTSSREYNKIELISNPISGTDMFMIKAFWLDAWGIVDTQDKVRASFKYTKEGIDRVSHQALREHWDETKIDRDITYREMEAERYSKQEAENKLFVMGLEYSWRVTVAQKARSHNNP